MFYVEAALTFQMFNEKEILNVFHAAKNTQVNYVKTHQDQFLCILCLMKGL